MSRMYTIGDREHGIMFIRTDPFRIIQIPIDRIEDYAEEIGSTTDEVFARLAGKFGDSGDDTFSTALSVGEGWDISRFFTMPAGEREQAIRAVTEIDGDRWDVSRFFTMPASKRPAEFCIVSDVDGDDWDISRFFTMPAGAGRNRPVAN